MGSKPPIDRRKLILILGVSAAVLLVLVIVLAVSGGPEGEEGGPQYGCKSDAECGPKNICAAGGCLILISSELPDIWRDDVRHQLIPPDGGPAWQPAPTYGEKLLEPSICPAPTGKMDPPNEKKLSPIVRATVFDIRPREIRLYKHMRAQASVWIDALRFWFPGFDKLDAPTVCASDKVAHVKIGTASYRGKTETYIDTALARAAPAGVVSAAAVSVRRELPQADKDDIRTLSFDLEAIIGTTARYHTIVTVPLGMEVLGIQGPPPTQQRLLIGFVAYYWEHGAGASHVGLRFRIPEVLEAPNLDLGKLNP